MHNTTTDTQYVGWYPSPDKRGTFNILQTCLSALFFCAYTALHLDVPWVKERRLSKTLHLAKWMAISIFFPEFLLFAAATQMLCATSVQRTVNKLYRKVCIPNARSLYACTLTNIVADKISSRETTVASAAQLFQSNGRLSAGSHVSGQQG